MAYYDKGFNDAAYTSDKCGEFSQVTKPPVTLRPCDCIYEQQAKLLSEQGIAVNDESIEIHPNYVLLTMGHTQVKIGMKRFQMFAEWYLQKQTIK
jgi:hypothetical protein